MPDDKVLNLQIVLHFNKFKQFRVIPTTTTTKMAFLTHSKMFSWVGRRKQSLAPGNQIDLNPQPPASACRNVTSTEICHLQEHHAANLSQLKMSSNYFFLLRLRGQYLKLALTKATMEMQSSKTEILGATKLDCIHMGTCVFLITRMDWIFYLQKKGLGFQAFFLITAHLSRVQEFTVHLSCPLCGGEGTWG